MNPILIPKISANHPLAKSFNSIVDSLKKSDRLIKKLQDEKKYGIRVNSRYGESAQNKQRILKVAEMLEKTNYDIEYIVPKAMHRDKLGREIPMPMLVEFMNARYNFLDKAKAYLLATIFSQKQVQNWLINKTGNARQTGETFRKIKNLLHEEFIIMMRKGYLHLIPPLNKYYKEHGRVNPNNPILFDSGQMVRSIRWVVVSKANKEVSRHWKDLNMRGLTVKNRAGGLFKNPLALTWLGHNAKAGTITAREIDLYRKSMVSASAFKHTPNSQTALFYMQEIRRSLKKIQKEIV